jgi:hypothetical protein
VPIPGTYAITAMVGKQRIKHNEYRTMNPSKLYSRMVEILSAFLTCPGFPWVFVPAIGRRRRGGFLGAHRGCLVLF